MCVLYVLCAFCPVAVPGLMGHYQPVGGSGGPSHVMNTNNPTQGGIAINE